MLNNPLAFTDPTGYSWWTQWRTTIFAIAAAATMQWYIVPELMTAAYGSAWVAANGATVSFVGAVAGGFAAGGIQGGNIESALQGALFAAAFYGVGEASGVHAAGEAGVPFGDPRHLAQVAGHLAVGCAQAAAAGGSCKNGALSAGFAALAGPVLPGKTGEVKNFVARVVAGGIGSRVAGGSFQGGAYSAAFAYLFNEVAGMRIRFSGFDRAANTMRGVADVWITGEDGPREIPVTSGRGTDDPRVPNEGPTPEGGYSIDPRYAQNMSLMDRLTGTNQGSNEPSLTNFLRLYPADWGDFRAPLSPYASTEAFGRTAMYIHGGNIPGSAGCIDFGSRYTSWLFSQIRATTRPIPVNVTYPGN